MAKANKPARPKHDRVQGIDSVVEDLTLRQNGRGLELELGIALTENPRLTRTISGASSIDIEVIDPDRRLLRHSLAAEQWEVELDDLKFLYPGGLSKSRDQLTLTLEDRWIALLRKQEGPKRAVRRKAGEKAGPQKMTRAEFIKMLVKEACGDGLRFYCPQLHVVQPIDSKAKADKAKKEAKENRGKGLGDVKHLTMDGAPVSKSQLDLGHTALEIAESHKAPFAVQVALIEALMAESGMGETAPGNVLQGIGSEGAEIADAPTEIKNFLVGTGGYDPGGVLGYYKHHPDAPPHQIAQALQKSEFEDGSNYGKFEDEAREWVETFGGEGAGEGIEVEEPYEFVVKKKQDYWSAIKELVKDVNWRAFIVADVFYLMPEPELLAGMVRLAIDGSTPGVENVDFEYDGNNPVTEVEIEALVSQWKPPPGSVITLADHGPASIGFGDAPVKEDSKGRKAAISSNRNARTGEGRGRYIVSSIEVPLSDDPAQRMAMIKAHRATPPLPEPAPDTHSVGGSGGSVGSGEMGDYAGSPEDIVNEVIDYAHGHGFPNVTRESVRAANAEHGPTISGGTSDHQGPPNVRWAADISNGESPTPEMNQLAEAIAEAFGIPWSGAGLVTHEAHGYRLQLIYKTMEGGNHFNHVHFGCAVA